MPQKNDIFPGWLKTVERLLSPWRRADYSVKRDHTPKFDALPQVQYGELRPRIHNGDLIFCGGNYAFSKMIRYFSGCSRVSHVGIVYWWKERLMVLESVETDGVRIVPFSQYVVNYENSRKPYNGRIYLARDRRLHVAPENEEMMASAMRNPKVDQLLGEAATLLNKKFSFTDVLAFLVQGATGRMHHEDNDEFLCSEFVARCFKKVNVTYPDDGRGFVAPEHIAMSDDVEALMEICG